MDSTSSTYAAVFPQPRCDAVVEIASISTLFAELWGSVDASVEDGAIELPVGILVWEEDPHSLEFGAEVVFVVAQRALGEDSCDHCSFL